LELKIAPEIATELAHLAAPLEKLPVRLVKPADIHLTLVAPWSEASIPVAWLAGSVLSRWSFNMWDTARSRDDFASSGLTAPLPMRLPPCTQRSCKPMGRRTSVRFGRT